MPETRGNGGTRRAVKRLQPQPSLRTGGRKAGDRSPWRSNRQLEELSEAFKWVKMGSRGLQPIGLREVASCRVTPAVSVGLCEARLPLGHLHCVTVRRLGWR